MLDTTVCASDILPYIQMISPISPRCGLSRLRLHTLRAGIIAALGLSLIRSSRAQSNTVDPSFNPSLVPNVSGYSVAATSDSAMYVEGQGRIYKASPGGAIDTTYNPPISTHRGGTSGYQSLDLQADGSAVVEGEFFGPGDTTYLLARLLPNGQMDPAYPGVTWPGERGESSYVSSAFFLPDGRYTFLLGSYAGDAEGELWVADPTSSAVPVRVLTGKSLAIHHLDSDDSLIVSGTPVVLPNGQEHLLVRFLPNLTRDTAFVAPPFVFGESDSFEVRLLEDSVAPGHLFLSFIPSPGLLTLNGAPAKGLYRLLPGGGSDPGFTPFDPPSIPDTQVGAFELSEQTGETLLIMANHYPADPFSNPVPVTLRKVDRLSGTVDTGFNPTLSYQGFSGWLWSHLGEQGSVNLKFEGGILTVNGASMPEGQSEFRLLADGSLDPTFAPPVRPQVGSYAEDGSFVPASEYEYSILDLSDGRSLILVGFSQPFTHVNGQPRSGIALLRADGSLDPDFKPVITFTEESQTGYAFLSVTELDDSSLILSGSFTAIDGQARPAGVARLVIASPPVGEGYAVWAASNNLPPAPSETADFEGDGVPDLMEFAFNLDPKTPDAHRILSPQGASGLPAHSLVGEGASRRLRLEFLRRTGSGPGSVSAVAEFVSDPTLPWTPVTSPVSIVPAGTGWERVTVDDPETTGTAAQRLARVRLTYVP
jgi:hypothetical protein